MLVPPAAYVWAAYIWLAPLVWVRGWDSYVPEKEGLQGESAPALTSQALQNLHPVSILSVLCAAIAS